MSAAVPSLKQSLGAIIGRRFPWLLHVVTVAGAKGKGLAFRTASGLLHLAGGPDDPAVVRVGDAGTGGTFATAGVTLGYTGADGTTAWGITALANTTTGVVTFTIVPVTGTSGAIVTKGVEGSDKVTCA